jgi:hypothetical protein
VDTAQVAVYLQQQFTGQLVLYVADMAKILGKSEKAIAGLIARDGLPFKVKLLGGLRCVDIFQVAQWLASTPGAAEEVAAAPAVPATRAKSVPSRKLGRREQVTAALSPSLPSMAQQLLEMRHDHAQAIRRFAGSCQGVEQTFIVEVADVLQGRGLRYFVSVRAGGDGFGSEAGSLDATTEYHNQRDAEDVLLDHLMLASRTARTHAVSYELSYGQHPLFRCSVVSTQFFVEVNELGLEFPGM